MNSEIYGRLDEIIQKITGDAKNQPGRIWSRVLSAIQIQTLHYALT